MRARRSFPAGLAAAPGCLAGASGSIAAWLPCSPDAATEHRRRLHFPEER
jgi:hypothetical protein